MPAAAASTLITNSFSFDHDYLRSVVYILVWRLWTTDEKSAESSKKKNKQFEQKNTQGRARTPFLFIHYEKNGHITDLPRLHEPSQQIYCIFFTVQYLGNNILRGNCLDSNRNSDLV